MIRKHILNGLTLSLMLSLIATPAHAGWFSFPSSISNYFNQPSKNALVATTAIAGVSLLALFAGALSWWNKSKTVVQKNSELARAKTLQSVQEELTAVQSKAIGLYQQQERDLQMDIVIKQQASDNQADRLSAAQDKVEYLQRTIHNQTQTHDELVKQMKENNLQARAEISNFRSEKHALEMQNESLQEELAQLHVYRKHAREQAAE